MTLTFSSSPSTVQLRHGRIFKFTSSPVRGLFYLYTILTPLSIQISKTALKYRKTPRLGRFTKCLPKLLSLLQWGSSAWRCFTALLLLGYEPQDENCSDYDYENYPLNCAHVWEINLRFRRPLRTGKYPYPMLYNHYTRLRGVPV